jgi:hypothetical protein
MLSAMRSLTTSVLRGLAVVLLPEFVLGDDRLAVLLVGDLIAPIAERALGELHDVALVDERYRIAVVGQRVVDRLADESL